MAPSHHSLPQRNALQDNVFLRFSSVFLLAAAIGMASLACGKGDKEDADKDKDEKKEEVKTPEPTATPTPPPVASAPEVNAGTKRYTGQEIPQLGQAYVNKNLIGLHSEASMTSPIVGYANRNLVVTKIASYGGFLLVDFPHAPPNPEGGQTRKGWAPHQDFSATRVTDDNTAGSSGTGGTSGTSGTGGTFTTNGTGGTSGTAGATVTATAGAKPILIRPPGGRPPGPIRFKKLSKQSLQSKTTVGVAHPCGFVFYAHGLRYRPTCFCLLSSSSFNLRYLRLPFVEGRILTLSRNFEGPSGLALPRRLVSQ
jgi:hypothetical protein